MCSSIAKHQPFLSNSLIFTISKFQIMKKSYISPELVIVKLAPSTAILSLSTKWSVDDSLKLDEGKEIGAANVEVKEVFSDINLWDDEW